MDDIILKAINVAISLLLTGLAGYLGKKISQYKKLIKKENDETVKATITTTLSELLIPVKEDVSNVKSGLENVCKDIAKLQNVEINFSTRLSPLQEEIEHLKDDITEILSDLKQQGIDLNNIREKEDHLEHQTRCAWRYRIRTLCFAYIKRGYMTHEEFSQLQEMYNLYVALGGNGQTKELYEKAMQLEIKSI